ncbi:IS66 family transposase [Ktedonosporobacter rubrisoli]|uniref:IS66 family transposase n=1 Tax=Ktedonosporobacter rubrisoli TaxID=2509675 RepID=A0A4P6JMU1_KTERU|nr:IS66 family transposase [Ktedonosporobacter rubrisoli]QBD75590.1 IS66 family transposase [Ktedonosporobacter rubrisoli]QBD75904.1 IS66 family transposase [Ktedonosporobacter rubrisoli]QBD76589.1 IS66 family transposase [Ktedonosporobacter rubrisoli]QBD76746.1 IS66 family transposase [Ktedonosporobacter rubrisoli]QBD81974.1 IS66 family transposase [Ktedonosporobacter rubrisoli]
MNKDDELEQLRQENDALRHTNRTLHECVRESIQAIGSLHKQIKELEGVIASQQEHIKALEGQVAKDSHNSSLPPSSDRFVRVPKSLRQPSGKKPGGQKGHRGHHLRQVQTPDEILVHPVLACSHCHRDLSGLPAALPERRQVIDLPSQRLWIKEHRVEEKQCPVCYHLTRASFPASVKAPTQYGRGIQTLATYLVQGQALPYARASQLLQELLGVQLSAGSIASFVKTCYHQLEEVETRLRAAVVKAKVLNQDETGMRVGTEGWWVHVCSTARLTYYAAHPSRGRVALDAIGIAPQFRGTSVHDGLQSYQSYCFTQALCNVHHLRELTFIEEELGQVWARAMKELLLDMKAEVERAKTHGQPQLDLLVLARLLCRYDEILAEGYLAHPPPGPPKKSAQGKRLPGRAKQSPARNLLDRFSQRKWEVLRFLHDFAVPFDNNQAERDLRMIKVQQKVSGCFRTELGIAMFCRIRSYLSTLRKQGIALFSAFDHLFSGTPVLPAFS